MQRTTLDPTNSYFFSQQSRESQRRLRKSFDYQALYGKTEEVVLATRAGRLQLQRRSTGENFRETFVE